MTKATKARPGAHSVLIVYALALLVGTHIPRPYLPELMTLQDKLLHLCAYAGLTVLALRALYRPRPSAGVIIGILVAIVVFAAFDELTQAWVPGRYPEFGDWLADLVGVAVGIVVGWLGFTLGRAGIFK